MSLLDRYLPKQDFESYEDFYANCRINVPEHFNFSFDVLDYYADNEPDRLALLWCDNKDGEEYISFGTLRERVNRTANMLRSLGIGKGDHVLLVLKSHPEFWNCILALHKLGAVAVPATHMLMSKDITYRVTLGNIKACVCTEAGSLLDEFENIDPEAKAILKHRINVGTPREGWIDYASAIAAASPDFPTPPKSEWPANTDVMLLYFTSGTSGFPKMVQHNFAYPLAHIYTAKFWQKVQDGCLHYTEAETGWMKAVWGKLYGQWLCGASVFIYEHDRFNAADMLQRMIKYKVTTFCAPPTIYRFLIKEDLSQYDLSCIKYCVTAGEAVNPTVYHTFLEKTGMKLHEAFGQTELVTTTANWPWDEPKPGSMGKATPGYRLELHDANDKKVELGEEGELCVSVEPTLPPGIFGGYHLDEEQTRAVWHDGFYHTGDIAWQDADGFFWYVGRADDVIKSSGYRIGPVEVESVLMKHPAVLECAVTGVPDPIRGQIVKATIVLTRGYTASDELTKELQQFVKQNTAPYKYPRAIEFVDSLPKTISGKIRRAEIKRRDALKYSN